MEKEYSIKLNNFILEDKFFKACIGKENNLVKIGVGTAINKGIFVPKIYAFFNPEKPKSHIKVVAIAGRLETGRKKLGNPFDTKYSPKEFGRYIIKYKIVFNEEKNLNDFLNDLK